MKKPLMWSVVAAVLMLVPSAFAVPGLQLYIDGATYNTSTETWVTTASSFDLYVIGLNGQNNVKVSMALEGLGKHDNPNCSIDVNGTNYNNFTFGYPPLSYWATNWNGGKDLPTHDIYPAWFAEFNAGSYGNVGKVGDATEGSWNPTMGYLSGNRNRGQFRKFTIKVNGDCGVHFDAYTLNSDGSIKAFAPFSHDAERSPNTPPPGVPEPATMLLFGLGLAGASISRRMKK